MFEDVVTIEFKVISLGVFLLISSNELKNKRKEKRS